MQGVDKIEKLARALSIATDAISRRDFDLCQQALSEADETQVSIAAALFGKTGEVDQCLRPLFHLLLDLFSLLTYGIIHYRHWRWWNGRLIDVSKTWPDYITANVQDLRVEVSRNCGTILHLQALHGGRPYSEIRLSLCDGVLCRRLAQEFRAAADALDAIAAAEVVER